MEAKRKITLVKKSKILAAPEQVGQSSLVPGPKIAPIVPVTSDTSPSVEHGGRVPGQMGTNCNNRCRQCAGVDTS